MKLQYLCYYIDHINISNIKRNIRVPLGVYDDNSFNQIYLQAFLSHYMYDKYYIS